MVLGWWHDFIGPGRAIDTDRFCVICVNYIGGCYGSTGPLSIDPATGERWGPTFPRVRFSDSVRAAMRLVDRLGIDVLHAGIGPSTGGMAVLDLAVMFPERVRNVVVVAAGMEVTPLQRIHNFEQIQAIANDPRFDRGLYEPGAELEGMKIARQINHKTFVSLRTLRRRGAEHRGRGVGGALVRRQPSDRVLHAAPGPEVRGPVRRELLPADPGRLEPVRPRRRRGRRFPGRGRSPAAASSAF